MGLSGSKIGGTYLRACMSAAVVRRTPPRTWAKREPGPRRRRNDNADPRNIVSGTPNFVFSRAFGFIGPVGRPISDECSREPRRKGGRLRWVRKVYRHARGFAYICICRFCTARGNSLGRKINHRIYSAKTKNGGTGRNDFRWRRIIEIEKRNRIFAVEPNEDNAWTVRKGFARIARATRLARAPGGNNARVAVEMNGNRRADKPFESSPARYNVEFKTWKFITKVYDWLILHIIVCKTVLFIRSNRFIE